MTTTMLTHDTDIRGRRPDASFRDGPPGERTADEGVGGSRMSGACGACGASLASLASLASRASGISWMSWMSRGPASGWLRGFRRPRNAARGFRRPRNAARDRGQTAIEFLGMTPFIILIMLVLWELALVGYTFMLAGNAADVGARAGAGAEYGQSAACRREAREDLPDAWEENVRITCRGGSSLYRARVDLKVPVLVPGLFDLNVRIPGDAASPQEG